MTTLKTFAALAFAAVSGTSFAVPETYDIDPTHTLPRFEYNHMGFTTQQSRFDKISGQITLDREAKTGAVNIVIDARSVDTGIAQLNEHIQSKGMFDTATYPSITFTSNDFTFHGDSVTSIQGALTINGVTKPVVLAVQSFKCMPHPRLKKDACGAVATTVIKRSAFNAGEFVPMVSDEVQLTIPVEAIKQ